MIVCFPEYPWPRMQMMLTEGTDTCIAALVTSRTAYSPPLITNPDILGGSHSLHCCHHRRRKRTRGRKTHLGHHHWRLLKQGLHRRSRQRCAIRPCNIPCQTGPLPTISPLVWPLALVEMAGLVRHCCHCMLLPVRVHHCICALCSTQGYHLARDVLYEQVPERFARLWDCTGGYQPCERLLSALHPDTGRPIVATTDKEENRGDRYLHDWFLVSDAASIHPDTQLT